jgi:ubiquinone/menaquinone biosynthesis C-methylase UbiE
MRAFYPGVRLWKVKAAVWRSLWRRVRITPSLFDRVGINEGQLCLDVACGGGDGTLELARRTPFRLEQPRQ